MAGGSAFGGFVEGLMAGQAHADKRRLSRSLDRIYQQKGDLADWQWDADMGALEEQYKKEHGSLVGFEPPQRTQIQDPFLKRRFDWLKGKLGFGQNPTAGAQAQQLDVKSPVIEEGKGKDSSSGIPFMADGGRLPYGQEATGLEPEDVTLLPNENSGVNYVADAFDDTRRVWNAADDAMQGRVQDFKDAEGAMAKGNAAREWLWEGTKGTLATGAAALKDVYVDNPIVQGIAGFVGFDGEGDQPAGVLPEPTPETTAGPTGAGTKADEQVASGAIDAPEKTDGQVADAAIQEGAEMANEDLDYVLLSQQGVTADDMPVNSTQEWSDYRYSMFEAALSKGASPQEALQQVDDMVVGTQMRGMQRELQKAASLLQLGDVKSASLALHQAYQYFPNGVQVKFGMAQGKDGRPALVGTGFDEATGEPTGKPWIITPERVSAMAENMTNPAAFRTWTKDGRQLQLDVYKAKSTDDYRQGQLAIGETNAKTARMNAQAEALGGATGGIKPGERRQRDNEYFARLTEAGFNEDAFEDPATPGNLASAMTLLEMQTGWPPNTVYDTVTQAFRNGGEEAVQALLEQVKEG